MRHTYQAILLTLIIMAFAILNKGAGVTSKTTIDYQGGFDAASLESNKILDLEPKLDITSRAAGAYRLNGEAVFVWEEDKRWPIASITKLMTAVVADDSIDKDASIAINDSVLGIEGGPGGFSEGEIFKMSDLMKPLLMVSSNVAAEALASRNNKDQFVGSMNRYATRLGMKDTIFADPTGLSINNQSTISDLEKLVRFIATEKKHILSITKEKEIIINDIKFGRKLKFTNTNLFAGVPGFLGGKTGTIPEAVGNLVSVFEDVGKSNKLPIVIILLGSEDRFRETEEILNLYGNRS